MNRVTQELLHWLNRHDIPTDGVKVRIEFPKQEDARRAEACIMQELKPALAYSAAPFGTIETMNGIGLTLASREQFAPWSRRAG